MIFHFNTTIKVIQVGQNDCLAKFWCWIRANRAVSSLVSAVNKFAIPYRKWTCDTMGWRFAV